MGETTMTTGRTAARTAPDEFEAFPFTARCGDIWERGDHLLIGISPGNGYFTADRMAALVHWTGRRFSRIDVIYADMHFDEMFAAFGYPADRARRRAAKDVKATRRRALQGVARSGVDARVRALSEFTDDEDWRRARAEIDQAMGRDPEFRRACEATIERFLAGRLPEGGPWDRHLAAGLSYLKAELPFFIDSPRILGVASSVSCYHAEMPLARVLFTRESGLRAADSQGYAVVRPSSRPNEEEN